MGNCKNCRAEVNQNYCPNCGQPVDIKRINGRYIIHEIKQVLNVEKGIFYTIWELFIRPGENVRHFITENRSRLVKPVVFIIVTSLVYSLVNNFFNIEQSYVNYAEMEKSATGVIFKWVQDHYGYANIIMGIFIAFWTKLFFKKYNYNFFEILILLCFVMGMGMLIYSVFAIIQGLINYHMMQIAGFVGIVYTSWAIGQFYEKTKFVNYVKALFAYLTGMLTFTVAALIIGTIIDLLILK